MTNREFYTSVIEANVNEDLTAFATEAIAKLDKSNAQKAAKIAEKREAEQPLYDELFACLTEDPQTASDLAAQVEGIASTQKASAMLRKLVEAGKVVKTDIKVGSKSAKGYALA